MKNMTHDISLDHLKEEEVAMILKVLERDAQIQKNEDARRQKLRNSIKFERIPGKRLSVKLRTGDWVNEITDPSRQKEKSGTDVVRASIKRKKWKKEEVGFENIGEDADAERMHPPKPDVVIDADRLELDPATSPARKPSIRRKQVSKAPGKQVTFNDDKTEKIIFNDNKTPAEGVPHSTSGQDATGQQEVTVTPDEGVARNMQSQHAEDNGPSQITFERYHNSYALGTSQHELKADVQQDDKFDKEKSTKKVRVIKRKGSSRRKPISKITDDSDRDNLFRAPAQKEVQDVIENISETPVAADTVEAAKERSAASGMYPGSAPAASQDYSVQDSLEVEEFITVATTALVCGAPEPSPIIQELYRPEHGSETLSDQESSTVSKQESQTHHTAEMQYASTEPHGGDHEYQPSFPNDNGMMLEPAMNLQDEDHAKSEDLSYSTDTDSLKQPEGEYVASNILEIAQDYADVTLKPNDFPKMLESVANEASPHFDAEEDGGRTPTIAKSQDLDGMELLKEIEAVLPQVHAEALNTESTDDLSEDVKKDKDAETCDTSQIAHTNASKEAEGDDIKQGEESKPKKKVIRVIKKSKRDKPDGKIESPEHDSHEGIHDEARMLIDEVTKSMNAPSNDQQVAGRKKVVKKIIKKKKADDSNTDDQNPSPKKDDENPSEDADGEFGLARRKTVRRKVSKRQPPPPSAAD